MTLESIERLRDLRDEAASKMVDNPRWVCARAEEIADEIEREIAEKYIELPVDSDGVLIRIGDTVRELDDCVPMKVMSLTFYEDCVDVNACGMNPKLLLHVKPRTLESILCDALADVSCMGDGIVRTFKPDDPYVAELAAEIRELLGVSE